MCGIVAVLSRESDINRNVLHKAAACLAHRGPDSQQLWVSHDNKVGLGHRRLAIIDLHTGNQPISNEDDTIHIIVNGEFYDYQQIREQLIQRGHRFKTRSDSEIALHLYEESGVQALEQLRGEFALILWDERKQQLVAARDRFGIKPLFYAEYQNNLYLASEIKALLALGVPAAWNHEAFFDYLHICFTQERTLFRGIYQVPPGHVLCADRRSQLIRAYWDLNYPRHHELPTQLDEQTHLPALRVALTEAILTRLQADVPVGFHLSGGLDSSSIVGIVAAQQIPITTFTVSFDDSSYDEGHIARATAHMLGAQHYQIDVQRQDFADYIVAAIRAGEMIQENSHGIARYMQSQTIHAKGYKVVLAGEGGDELFAGYPHFQKDLEFTLSAEQRARTLQSYAAYSRFGLPPTMASLLNQLGFIPGWIIERYMSVTQPIMALLKDSFAQQYAQYDCYAQFLQLPGVSAQLEERTPFHQSLYLFCKTWFVNYILFAERLDLAHALELRLPFLDHHLFNFVKQTPLEWYTRQQQTKYTLRAAMQPYLTPTVYQGTKRGFFAPPVVQNPRMLSFIREVLHSDTMRQNPFFDQHKVIALLDRLSRVSAANQGYNEALLQLIFGTCVLQEQYHLAG